MMRAVNPQPMPYGLQRHAVYQLPSGHYVMVGSPSRDGTDVSALTVNAKIMNFVEGGQMTLRASFMYAHARLCWTADDWRRRVNDVAAEIVEQAARRERIDMAREMDVLRAKAIDAEHAARKAANRRLLRVAA